MKSFLLKTTSIVFFGILSSQTFALDLSKSTNIRADLNKACTEAYTKRKVLTNAEATKFCKCSIDSQAKMTNAEQWEIQSSINAKKDPETLAVTKRTKQEMDQCAGQAIITKVRNDAIEQQKKFIESQQKKN